MTSWTEIQIITGGKLIRSFFTRNGKIGFIVIALKLMLLLHTFNISPIAGRNAITITQIVVFRKAEIQ